MRGVRTKTIVNLVLSKTCQVYVWPYWLGYLVAATLGLYTLYYFVFLLIVINLFFLLELGRASGGLARFKGFKGMLARAKEGRYSEAADEMCRTQLWRRAC